MKARSKIVIVPIGDLDFFQINRLAGKLSETFSAAVDIVQGTEPPPEAYHPARLQYFSTVILGKLERMRANDREKILGIIDEDLYIPTRPFVYNEADPHSGCAILSCFRVKQEFYGLPEDEKIIFQRVKKEALTMIGHLFLLQYCKNPRCVMYRAASMLDTDEKGDTFCDNCRRYLVRKPV